MRKLKLPGRKRDSPLLTTGDVELIKDLGISELKVQARKIVGSKLEEQPENDGKQTPSAGNPVYKAMHACKCSSRRELSGAHRIPAGRDLRQDEVDAVVNLLVRWMVREYNFFQEERKKQQRNLGEFA